MAPSTTTIITSAIAAAIVAFGSFKFYGFIRAIKMYKDTAKSQSVKAPMTFLQLPDGTTPSKQLSFFRINDEVMGGKSSSMLKIGQAGELEFNGVINMDGGGFASFRSLGDEGPLGLPDNAQTLVVDATGDGQKFKATLHTADSWSMATPTFAHDFKTSNTRQTYRLPLKAFVGSRQGQPVTGSLKPNDVTGFGFNLSLYTMHGKPNVSPDFGPGPFNLKVHSVKIE